MSASRKLLFYAIVWFGTGLVLLAGIELVLPHFAPPGHLSHHRWGNRPHTFLPGVVQRAASAEFDVRFRTNSLGFNDLEHAVAKPPGRFRVLLLGDSFVEGIQVAPERHMARLLEGMASRDRRSLEVIAMGSSGWGQSHELATYESVGRRFDPDLVVVFFCPNDLFNNLVGVEGEEGPAVYDLDSKGRLVANLAGVPEQPPTAASFAKHERSPRFPGVRELRRRLRAAYRMTLGDVRGAARAAALNEAPAPHPSGAAREARGTPGEQQRMLGALVAELKRCVVDRDHHELLSVTVSGNLYIPSNRPHQRMLRWAADAFARQGIDNLNLDALFRERLSREGRYPSWPDDAHWNETGHAWVAETLYARIEPRLRARP